MLEREIESQILLWLEEMGIYAWKNATTGFFDPKRKIFRKPNSRFQIKGTSDIIGVLSNGRILCIEVKARRGIIRPEQRKFLEEISKSGGFAMIARSLLEVKEAFAKHLDSP